MAIEEHKSFHEMQNQIQETSSGISEQSQSNQNMELIPNILNYEKLNSGNFDLQSDHSIRDYYAYFKKKFQEQQDKLNQEKLKIKKLSNFSKKEESGDFQTNPLANQRKNPNSKHNNASLKADGSPQDCSQQNKKNLTEQN